MGQSLKTALALAGLAVVLTAQPAEAACRTLGFSVNDFGKDVPTRDSRSFLQDYIKRWTKEQGIGRYRVGKTTTTCKFYLKLPILGEEYTCKSQARVCW
ncbi:MAG: hypothetical protein ACR2PO_17910 [Methyloligellaceae bacterium]